MKAINLSLYPKSIKIKRFPRTESPFILNKDSEDPDDMQYLSDRKHGLRYTTRRLMKRHYGDMYIGLERISLYPIKFKFICLSNNPRFYDHYIIVRSKRHMLARHGRCI